MKFACVDIETSGTIASYHDVIEVAVVTLMVGTGGRLHECDSVEFSVPFDPKRATEEALKINGWGQRDFAPQVTHEEARKILFDTFGPYKSTAFVAMHAHFDAGFLEAMLARYCTWDDSVPETPWRKHVYDLPSYFCGVMNVLPPMRSNWMASMLGIEELEKDRHHSALEDAHHVADIFTALWNRCR